MPLAIVTGPFLPDLIISISSIIFLVKALINKSIFQRYFFSKYFFFLFSFWVFLIFSSLLSSNIILSLESSLFYIRFPIFSLFVFYLLNENEKFLKRFMFSFFIIFGFVLIDSLFMLIVGYDLLFIPRFDENRLSGLFQSELRLGSYVARLLPFLFLVLIYFNKNLTIKLISIFLLILSLIIVVASGERTALFLYLFFGFICNLIYLSNIKFFLIISFFIILFAALIIFNVPIFYERLILSTFNQLTAGDSLLLFSFQHQQHYINAIQIFIDHPIIGAGPKIFREICVNYSHGLEYACSTHPHNSYIQALAETGIIGFLFLIIAFIYVLTIFVIKFRVFFISNMKKKNDELKFFLILSISVLITLWPVMPTNNFFNNWINSIYYLPIGFYFYFINQIEKKSYRP